MLQVDLSVQSDGSAHGHSSLLHVDNLVESFEGTGRLGFLSSFRGGEELGESGDAVGTEESREGQLRR